MEGFRAQAISVPMDGGARNLFRCLSPTPQRNEFRTAASAEILAIDPGGKLLHPEGLDVRAIRAEDAGALLKEIL
jgi:hypothetical protein